MDLRSVVVLTCLVAAVLLFVPPAAAEPSDPRLAAVDTFAFALGQEVDTDAEVAALAPYELIVLDGELTPPARVAQLRAGGSVVLGYLSVGTIEPFRTWYRKLKPYRLKDRFDEFDEFYARVSARGFRRAIAGRIAPKVLSRGFDGLFLDNVDMIELHPRERRGMSRLVGALARLVHRRGGVLFSQNGDRSIKPMLRFLDGWNREDVTWTYSFKRKRYVRVPPRDTAEAQAALRRIDTRGLLVTSSDYTATGDAAAESEAVANACAAAAVPFVSDIALRRLPAAPLICP
jgi:uncharacterized protein (TIGR01370 family)